jgi:hypothetical protein
MYNECRHIFTSGKKCQSPAPKEQNFCYFHNSNRKRPAPKDQAYEPYIAPQDTAHHLTPLEDADAIQLALSDVVLALAANRIDPRRARILIYGLQVASQNHRNRSAMAAKETAAAQTVREIQVYEDGTLIGPAKQSPDPEEVAERKRPPSLGEILLREAEAMRAERIAKEEAAAAESEKHPISLNLPQIQAVADTPPAEQRVESPLHPSKAPKPREAREKPGTSVPGIKPSPQVATSLP